MNKNINISFNLKIQLSSVEVFFFSLTINKGNSNFKKLYLIFFLHQKQPSFFIHLPIFIASASSFIFPSFPTDRRRYTAWNADTKNILRPVNLYQTILTQKTSPAKIQWYLLWLRSDFDSLKSRFQRPDSHYIFKDPCIDAAKCIMIKTYKTI